MKNNLGSWVILVLAALCDCFTLYIVKWRSNAVGGFDPSSIQDAVAYGLNFVAHPRVWLGVFTFALGLPLGYVALTRLPVTVMYPVNVVLHISLTFIIGVFALNEKITPSKLVGVLLILVAVYLITGRDD